MMSARPGRILDIRDVDFARPRTLAMTYTSEFTAIVQHLRMQIVDSRGVSLETA
jgi:NitT/TauT family transport system ATP-binding protein